MSRTRPRASILKRIDAISTHQHGIRRTRARASMRRPLFKGRRLTHRRRQVRQIDFLARPPPPPPPPPTGSSREMSSKKKNAEGRRSLYPPRSTVLVTSATFPTSSRMAGRDGCPSCRVSAPTVASFSRFGRPRGRSRTVGLTAAVTGTRNRGCRSGRIPRLRTWLWRYSDRGTRASLSPAAEGADRSVSPFTRVSPRTRQMPPGRRPPGRSGAKG